MARFGFAVFDVRPLLRCALSLSWHVLMIFCVYALAGFRVRGRAAELRREVMLLCVSNPGLARCRVGDFLGSIAPPSTRVLQDLLG